MKLLKRMLIGIPVLAAAAALALWLLIDYIPFGFAREVEAQERELREQIVATAESWLDTAEGSRQHREILEIYNSHEPLAQGYEVKEEDNWCATFASAVAIQCDATGIVPTECGCQRQIGLWQEIGRWEEDDNYLPLPGDYIYYAWDEDFTFGDCTGWADHVGIVVGTAGPLIKVIEGNRDDSVTYRIILRGNWQIRGYGLPDYYALSEQKTAG